jgi:hypothetical protein
MSSQRWESDGARSGLSDGWSKMVNLCSIHPCNHISSHIIILEENMLHIKKNSTDTLLHFLCRFKAQEIKKFKSAVKKFLFLNSFYSLNEYFNHENN